MMWQAMPTASASIRPLNVVAEEGTSLSVYNVNGVLVMQETYAGQSLDVSGLAAGIYFIRNSAGEVARFIVK